MRIKAVAKLVGVTPQTIRKLESKGILPTPDRDWNDQRRYTDKDVDAIRRALYAPSSPPASPEASASPRSDKVRELVERLQAGRKRSLESGPPRG
jgi:DNA-binding transcriptional MerR regulator